MTQDVSTTTYEPPTYSQGSDDSTKDVAKDQAASVAQSTREAGQHVAGVAKEEAGNVASEATRQARDIAGQARDELGRQAADQQQRVAGGLRSLGTELGSMAERSEQSGVATDLARQAAGKAHEVADWLEQRDPSSLLDEVSGFARRRPGTFLAIALAAGLAAGRVTRGLKDESSNGTSSTPNSTPARATGYPPPAAGYTGTDGTTDPYAPLPGDEVVEVVEVVEPVYPAERGFDGETR